MSAARPCVLSEWRSPQAVTSHTALFDGAGHATPHDRFETLKVAVAPAEGAVAAGAASARALAQLKPMPLRVADGSILVGGPAHRSGFHPRPWGSSHM